MKVTLAGYNIDKKLIEHIPDQEAATPETISAAYARISRDPRDVHELREEALKQVKKSRKSNQAIVFGMSHHSVAEHAYFNFDILDISRLALEELEARRIGAAYTEKSQRYITLDGDFVIPKEFEADDRKSFRQLIEQQNKFYLSNLEELTKYQFKQNPELAEKAFDSLTKGISNKMNRAKNSLEGWAKEDARYVLSLATQGQLGLSFNARTLEHAIRIMRHSELAEVRELSQKLFDTVKTVAPSLIILSDPDEFKKAFKSDLKDDHFRFTKRHLRKIVEAEIKKFINDSTDQKQDIIESGDAKLLPENVIDKDILIALFHNNSLLSYEESDKIASKIL
ncbi:MAG: FAD-dependent thymidylate synthase, partial [Candidatus Cloacimonetes bacterium]|nr:FAD-dependent thymidylate synthase [Candidatus Cloacimonadota bacterium]